MQAIIMNVSWTAVIVGGAVAFLLGSLWYSPMMFGTRWRQGLGAGSVHDRPLMPTLVIQAVATFLFAWLLVVAAGQSLALACLVAITVSAALKANGFFSGKSIYAIATEAGFVLAQAAIVLIAFQIFK